MNRTSKPRVNAETPPADQGGVIFVRKEFGRKLHFVMGGPTFENAQKYVRQNPGWVALWRADDGRMFYLFPTQE